jgi:FkbM family methyltransferase
MSENFPIWVKVFGIEPAPLIHVGAHLAQERDDYRNLGFEPVLWFEAQPEIAKRSEEILVPYTNQRIINVGLWSTAGVQIEFFIAGHEGSSSSLLEPFLISASHPDVTCSSSYKITTSTLDHEADDGEIKFRILVLDVQGAELEVLKGGQRALQNVDYIFSEISTLELYRKSPRAGELSKYLEAQGYVFAASDLNRDTGWGEGLFIRKNICDSIPNFQPLHESTGKFFPKGRIFRSILVRLRSVKPRISRTRRNLL